MHWETLRSRRVCDRWLDPLRSPSFLWELYTLLPWVGQLLFRDRLFGSHKCHALPLAPSNFLRRSPIRKQLGNTWSLVFGRTDRNARSVDPGSESLPARAAIIAATPAPKPLPSEPGPSSNVPMFRCTSGSTPCTCL